ARLTRSVRHDAFEAELQQTKQLAHDRRRAALRGGEVAMLVAQEQDSAIVLQALGRQPQRLVKERLRLETLHRKIADAQQHFHARLTTVQLLGEARRQWRLAVTLCAVRTHALHETLDLFDRERLGQVVVRAMTEPEHPRI